jgi:hypothetical protein
VVLGAGVEVECDRGAAGDAAVPAVRVGDGDREPVQGGRPAVADVLGALLVRLAAGDGGRARVPLDPALFHRQARGRGVARAAAVPRRDHPLRDLRAPAFLRRHGDRARVQQALRLPAQVPGHHQPGHAHAGVQVRRGPRARRLREAHGRRGRGGQVQEAGRRCGGGSAPRGVEGAIGTLGLGFHLVQCERHRLEDVPAFGMHCGRVL